VFKNLSPIQDPRSRFFWGFDVSFRLFQKQMVNNGGKKGRVIRRYGNNIPIEDFPKWQDLIKTKERGCGLYALYRGDNLMYVGLATQSIRSRIEKHMSDPNKPFTHFAVFLVTGSDTTVRKRQIRDLEALLLNIIKPRPKWNSSVTHFVAARKLKAKELTTKLKKGQY